MSNGTLPWQNRWKITASLTTASPLHIGGCLPQKRDIYPKADKKKKDTVDVTSVVTDFDSKPYLPGSTIKGNIRAWMEKRGYNEKLIESIFGSEHSKKQGQVGGKAEFYDAFWNGITPVFTENPPYWEKDRLTSITASVAIDRTTGTACDKKLFHLEYVPSGVTFVLSITGQDMEQAEVALLCHALEDGFNIDQEEPISIGSSTANEWGRFAISDFKIEQLEATGVQKWLENPTTAGYAIPMTIISEWRNWLSKLDIGTTEGNHLKITLKLSFDGPFLVNDQSKSKSVTGDDHDADMSPRRGTDGKVSFPAESFRGAFRSQAERIIRTIGGHACTPTKPCKAIKKKGEETGLCPACRLFGAAGWKTAVSVPQFVLESCSQDKFMQEFVAIDRFTGGGRDGAKFNAMSVLDPVFAGTLKIDLDRVEPWALGLLVFSLRDLCEGDISFGFGAAKGYGECKAVILKVSTAWSNVPERFKQLLVDCEIDTTAANWRCDQEVTENIQLLFMELLGAFQNYISNDR